MQRWRTESKIAEDPMRNLRALSILTALIFAIAGCGGGRSEPPHVFVADILSDQTSDGDIAYDPGTDTFTITHGPDTLFFGIDEVEVDSPEYRAFLDFPLDGSTGYDAVPAHARIVSATLEVFIDTVEFAARIPTIIDLVSYPIGALRPTDFDSEPLSEYSLALDFFAEDMESYVAIDVTELMAEAQRLGLLDFQVRFTLDFSTANGLVGIQDLPTVSITAPLLSVTYTYE
jgi:hypothetical protein